MAENQNPLSQILPIFGWADTPWTVAALLGVWGVMIGIEEFFLADVFMVLACAFCTWRLAVDCFVNRRHRWIPFVLWFLLIIAVISVDIHLTARKKASAEAKAQEIPGLIAQIQTLQGTVNQQSSELSKAQGKTDQHVTDIQQENSDLKKSIEKKDAALVSIANKQYDLNFSPEVVAMVQQNPNQIFVQNLGKTAVTVYRVDQGGVQQNSLDLPHELVQNASESYSIFPEKEKAVADSATFDPQTKEYRTSIESIVYIDSQDHKRYTLPFTWVFTVADGKITKSFATDHPITEVK